MDVLLPDLVATPRACDKCTKSKRKCDKKRPQCSRCHRLKAICVYDTATSPSNEGSASSDSGGVAGTLHDATIGTAQVIALFQTYCINWREAVSTYFKTIHPWFPIIRQGRIYQMLSPTTHFVNDTFTLKELYQLSNIDSTDEALLILSICLITDTSNACNSGRGNTCSLYRAIKQAYALHSCLASPTLETIQCGALIALFEFGYGEAKFAYRTLGDIAIMGRVIGLRTGKYLDGMRSTSCETEVDKRTLWWAIFILDQYIHMDPSTRYLDTILNGPQDDDVLPTESGLWDGDSYTKYAIVLPSNAAVSTCLGSFQRAAQSATLLYKVYRYDKERRRCDTLPHVSQFAQLDLEVRALLEAMLAQCDRWENFCDAFAMSMESLCILYAPYLASDNIGTSQLEECVISENTQKAIAAIRFCMKFVIDLAVSFNNHLDQHPEWLANLAPPAAFICASAAEHMLILHNLFENAERGFTEIYKALETFSKRWKVGYDMLDRLRKVMTTEKLFQIN